MAWEQNTGGDSKFSNPLESGGEESEIPRLSAENTRALEEAGATLARELNGPLTALRLYMGEIKQHSRRFAQSSGDEQDYLQKIVDNAVQQTERICAMVKQIAGAD